MYIELYTVKLLPTINNKVLVINRAGPGKNLVILATFFYTVWCDLKPAQTQFFPFEIWPFIPSPSPSLDISLFSIINDNHTFLCVTLNLPNNITLATDFQMSDFLKV